MLDCDKIKSRREKLGLSQEEAAEKAGLGSRQRWNDIETGRKPNVGLDTLEKVADALGCDARDLLTAAKAKRK